MCKGFHFHRSCSFWAEIFSFLPMLTVLCLITTSKTHLHRECLEMILWQVALKSLNVERLQPNIKLPPRIGPPLHLFSNPSAVMQLMWWITACHTTLRYAEQTGQNTYQLPCKYVFANAFQCAEMQLASSPSESERLRDGSRVCETNMPLTHREHTDPQLPASCSSYESTSCCDYFLFF